MIHMGMYDVYTHGEVMQVPQQGEEIEDNLSMHPYLIASFKEAFFVLPGL